MFTTEECVVHILLWTFLNTTQVDIALLLKLHNLNNHYGNNNIS